MKKQKGITLIALVITIVVLIILAGVAINLSLSEDGILSKAKQAREQYKKAEVKEEAEVILADWQSDYVVKGTSYEGRIDTTASGASIACLGNKIIVTDNSSGKVYSALLSDLETGTKLTWTEKNITKDSQIYKAMHPEEQEILTGKSPQFKHIEGTWNSGFVIKEKTGENEYNGDEFVWIPVLTPEDYVKKAGAKNLNVSYVGTDPEGTDYVQTGGITGDALGLTSILGQSVTNATNVQYPEKQIVCSAGGFYVARYEMGIESQTRTSGTQENVRNDSTVYYSQKGKEPVREVTQQTALSISNSWKSSNPSVLQSGLMTGTQWDVICNFLGWDICNGDCTNWGNFVNINSKEYLDNEAWHAGFVYESKYQFWMNTAIQKGNRNVQSDKERKDKMVFGTGQFIGISSNGKETNTKNKNIYDFAGNVWEWTTEVPKLASENRVIRGGSTENWGHEYNATTRIGHNPDTQQSWNVGFRAVLYVK